MSLKAFISASPLKDREETFWSSNFSNPESELEWKRCYSLIQPFYFLFRFRRLRPPRASVTWLRSHLEQSQGSSTHPVPRILHREECRWGLVLVFQHRDDSSLPSSPLYSLRLHEDKSEFSQNLSQACKLLRKFDIFAFASVLPQDSGQRRLRVSLVYSVDTWFCRHSLPVLVNCLCERGSGADNCLETGSVKPALLLSM